MADIDFVEVADGENVDIRVGMDTDDGPGGTLGVAYSSFFVNPGTNNTFAQVHIVFDIEDYDGDEDSVEFLSTAIHEVGHALGLDHEDDVPAIMSTFSNAAINGLTIDDIAGAQAIYGVAAGATAVDLDDPGVDDGSGSGGGGGGTTDDYSPDSVATNGSVSAPGSVNGDIETDGDEDWFAVTLTEGREYQFALNGTTLSDPLLQLRDSTGALVTSNDDGGPGLNSLITYTATATGTFYLVARAFSSQTGTYSLTVQDVGVATVPGITISEGSTDAPGDTSTTDTIVSGDTFEGTLSSTSDRDFVAIELTAGVQYGFALQGAGTNSGTLADGFLVLRDANGNFVEQDDNSGTADDAHITYMPSTTGTFYLDIRTFGDAGGTYALVTSPDERTADDPVPEEETDTIIPGITITEGSTDATASTDTTAAFISGDTFEGELDSTVDRDWVQVDLTAGTEYTFDLEGADTDGGTLADPFLVLRDANGGFVAQDEDGGTGANAQIVFTPDSTSTYYVEVRTFGGQAGTYTLSSSPGERTEEDGTGDSSGDGGGGSTPTPGQTVAEGDTDAAGDTSTTAMISPNDTFNGELDVAGDRDFIAIDLTAGTQYSFEVQGADSGSGTTLPDPFLVLRDANGGFVAQDDNSGTGLDALITFTPETSGTYYLSVRNFNGETGTYSVVTSGGSASQSTESASGEGYVSGGGADISDLGLELMQVDLL